VSDARILHELELDQVVRLYRAPAPAAASVDASIAPPATPAIDVASLDWEGLRETVRACRLCGLCAQRKQAVLGVGDVHAQWLFVGEGPGADEDEQGEPFVGQAGKLLDSMLNAVGIKRGEAVYIANVVKCRPPGNRTPTPEEARACAPYLDRQVDLIGPRLIVALGKTAATRLLGTEASLASLRGKVHAYRGIPVVVTYHPAYLLRSLPEKAKAWEDLLFARRTLARAA
jgi:DNA polymerase